jgi:hypothetical protein
MTDLEIESSQNQLIFSSQEPIWKAVTISVFLLIGGVYCCLFGVLLVKDKHPFAIFVGILLECTFSVSTLYFIGKNFETVNYVFDRATNHFYIQKSSRLKISKPQTIKVPLELIFGIEIETVMDEGTGYYPRLILKSTYWRIYVGGNGQHQNAIDFVTAVANFLNVPYFSWRSPAPSPALPQQILEKVDSELFSWRYLQEAEIDRLRQHLNLYPDDAEAHLSLGFLLYYVNKWLNRKKAIVCLQQAENLFECQQNSDRAIIAKALAVYISWN